MTLAIENVLREKALEEVTFFTIAFCNKNKLNVEKFISENPKKMKDRVELVFKTLAETFETLKNNAN